jgi:MtN3 and saliva related transmembrane protein
MSSSMEPSLLSVAACVTTLSFFPQALKRLRSLDTSGISLRMHGLFPTGIALWVIDFLSNHDGPLIVANGVTLPPAGIVLEPKIQAVLGQRSQL